ncbi:Uncharacterized protein BP5553_06629 [Venustampulla echinocandica]|uniref:F-box domain-containing protein n=1 Tax=Venustampulla echinocandica TaxID=2656787 RepID=A0A370TKI8_9HELO|nr:Uncharacterized protein BP5553_06629 [Venustampulla echinocandica]RDL36017.1 Uncharacterized protein BP5553_06629 [Venustampulla echinocandica]
MALDAQSNWNVEMPQRLKPSISQDTVNSPSDVSGPPSPKSSSPIPHHRDASREILLPTEIITQILSYLPRRAPSQSTFYSCSLVSRAWYSAAVTFLYERPYLTGGNFNSFVQTVCPSKNAHIRKSPLSILVKRLDMSALVHNSSRSLTARLLGRLKGNIEEFVAPQSSFGINSFAALSKCTKLHFLDLSLISASISNRLLFQALKSLEDLEILFFPRSSSRDERDLEDSIPYIWPPKLKALHLAGGVDDYFLTTHLANLPSCVEKLSIQHCSQVHGSPLRVALGRIGPQLQHLTIRHPMPRLAPGDLDYLLSQCPKLIALRVSADYITLGNLFINCDFPHHLRILDLDASSSYTPDLAPTAAHLYFQVEEGRFPDLRSVRVSSRLGWYEDSASKIDVSDLQEVMEDHDSEVPLGIPTGVWKVD